MIHWMETTKLGNMILHSFRHGKEVTLRRLEYPSLHRQSCVNADVLLQVPSPQTAQLQAIEENGKNIIYQIK